MEANFTNIKETISSWDASLKELTKRVTELTVAMNKRSGGEEVVKWFLHAVWLIIGAVITIFTGKIHIGG